MHRVAALQMVSTSTVSTNLAEAARLIEKAVRAGAKLIVLPENFSFMGEPGALVQIAEVDGQGPAQEFLATQARTHGVWLVGGTVPLRSASGKLRSACLVYSDLGERMARYDKLHLFDVELPNGEKYQESQTIEPGTEIVVVDTPLGRLGLAICYDLRFPELFRALIDRGAELLAVPSAFTAETGRAHWEVLVRSRAIENLSYVLAADQGGTHATGRKTHGDSMIVNPWGEILDRLPQGPGYAIAEIDVAEATATRARLPSLSHRRIHA
jgi:nitrilase